MSWKPFSFTPERFFLVFSILGACALAYVFGASTLQYDLPGARPLRHAFEAAAAWKTALEDAQERRLQTTSVSPLDDKAVNNANVTWDESAAYRGYTLLSYRFSPNLYLIDMRGAVVRRWNIPFEKIFPSPTHVHNAARARTNIRWVQLLPGGDMLVVYEGFGDTPYGYGIAKLDKDGGVIWRYAENAHHFLSVDKENGNIYGVIHKVIQEPQPGAELLRYPMLADSLIILSPEGKELKRISLLEAFRDSPYAPLLYRRGTSWDQFHTNSVRKLEPELAAKFPMFKPGQLLISMKRMEVIAVVDPNTSKVVWAARGPWGGQHDAQFLENGNILLFDNWGYAEEGKTVFSRALEVNPATLAFGWHYDGSTDKPLNSSIFGAVQRLPNGNTLIVESMKGRAIEVTPDKRVVWRFEGDAPPARGEGAEGILPFAVRYSEDELPFLRR